MLEWCSIVEMRISSPGLNAARGRRPAVDRLGGAAHEDDFPCVGGVDEAAHLFARPS